MLLDLDGLELTFSATLWSYVRALLLSSELTAAIVKVDV